MNLMGQDFFHIEYWKALCHNETLVIARLCLHQPYKSYYSILNS